MCVDFGPFVRWLFTDGLKIFHLGGIKEYYLLYGLENREIKIQILTLINQPK